MDDDLPTISSLAREYGIPRVVVSALIAEHDLKTRPAGRMNARLVPEPAQARLRPILAKLRARRSGGRRRVAASA